MFDKVIPADIIFYILLYGAATMASLIACLYLCLRKGNAIKPDVTPPVQLRHWAVALFGVSVLGHLWWLLFYIYSVPIYSVGHVVVCLLDWVTLLITINGTLLAMLQDRKRPVWPIVVSTIPLVFFGVLHIVNPDAHHFIRIAFDFFLLSYLLFSIYMVVSVRQYGLWLRNNYSDLENKEVWQSHSLIIAFFLIIILYGVEGTSATIGGIMQASEILIFYILLWRIETLPQLENVSSEQTEDIEPVEDLNQQKPQPKKPLTIPSNIEQLLDEHCVHTQLYLQHDLSLSQLARAVGTNHSYLSQYFSQQGINYNTYINNLRIDHFVNLYREASAAGKSFTAQQLANESGYRSYSTFSAAFKRRMEQTVTAWMSDTTK